MRTQLMMILLATLGVSGCRPGADSPPSVRYGEDACARCRMIISEERSAAAWLSAHGEWRKFDDIGCLALHHASVREAVSRLWVRAYEDDAWLDATTAIFVHSPQIVTPMGYGIAAAATEEAATSLAARVNGQLLSYGQLNQAVSTAVQSSDGPVDHP